MKLIEKCQFQKIITLQGYNMEVADAHESSYMQTKNATTCNMLVQTKENVKFHALISTPNEDQNRKHESYLCPMLRPNIIQREQN